MTDQTLSDLTAAMSAEVPSPVVYSPDVLAQAGLINGMSETEIAERLAATAKRLGIV